MNGLLLQVTHWRQHDFIATVAAISGATDADCVGKLTVTTYDLLLSYSTL